MKFNKTLLNMGEFTNLASMAQPAQQSVQMVQVENYDFETTSMMENKVDKTSLVLQKIASNFGKYRELDAYSVDKEITFDIEDAVNKSIFTEHEDQKNLDQIFLKCLIQHL